MAKAVATTEAKVPAVDEEFAGALAAYGGQPTGFENDRQDDYIIPFFTILQGLSPQMQTVDGAKLGYVINTSSNELFPNGINLVVVQKRFNHVEWAPNRGGLVAVHDANSDVVKKALEDVGGDKYAKLHTDAGNDLMETKYLVGMLCDDDKVPLGMGSIGFAVTKIKRFNAWNTDARNKLAQFGLPLHALIWHFGVQKERNEKGEFFNWSHSLLGGSVKSAVVDPVANKPLFDAVAGLVKRADEVKLDHAGERGAEASGDAM